MRKYTVHEKINIRSQFVETVPMKAEIPYKHERLYSFYETNNFAVKPYFKKR